MRHSVDFISYGPEMHHCASLTKNSKGYFMACYHGKECHDEQRVVIGFAEKPGEIIKHTDLPEKTGNPVVWTFNDEVYLMFSSFTDATEDGTPIDYGMALVERWKNCDNFLAKVDFIDGEAGGEIDVQMLGRIGGAYGLLGRCQPLIEKDRVLIPLYRESDPICQIWEFKEDTSLTMLSEFGYVDEAVKKEMGQTLTFGNLGNGVAIQPTLIKVKGGYRVFCRNVCRPLDSLRDAAFAWTDYSEDCINWKGITNSGIPNHNNSIAAINTDKGGYIVYNDNRRRNTLWLLNISNKDYSPISLHHPFINKRKSFSYPNISMINGEIHIVHTNCKTIAWHRFDKEYIKNGF